MRKRSLLLELGFVLVVVFSLAAVADVTRTKQKENTRSISELRSIARDAAADLKNTELRRAGERRENIRVAAQHFVELVKSSSTGLKKELGYTITLLTTLSGNTGLNVGLNAVNIVADIVSGGFDSLSFKTKLEKKLDSVKKETEKAVQKEYDKFIKKME